MMTNQVLGCLLTTCLQYHLEITLGSVGINQECFTNQGNLGIISGK